ncbi:hypothetical protein SAMN05421759_101162 [Roseivivax lentus]|uniref:Uncharacterized protein n=1 Tax=Roseivivax lentus TaxID=633194 RepID=A0A1N7JR49_9RHOB|nr:hypothetical protein [Roseivivax lentus]SIS51704.1 hypothetical protein SAMN05421759_101162 [Roseivivax lentus]
MQIIADILLAAGALGAAFYCYVLSKRLRAFNDLEGGMGSAVAVLSAQVDDMRKALGAAQTSAGASSASLTQVTDRAEDAARRLELLVASLHDLQDGTPAPSGPAPAPRDDARPVFARHPRREAAE